MASRTRSQVSFIANMQNNFDWKRGTFHKIKKLDLRSTVDKSLPDFAPSFPKWQSQGGSNTYSRLGLGNHYSYMPPWIPHRLFIHEKK
jgi:hypothetical protein